MVPKENLVGEKNRGIYYIMEALDYERISTVAGLERDFQEIVDYVKENNLSVPPRIREEIAEMAVEVESAGLLGMRVAWMLDKGQVPNYEAAMIKLYHSELQQRECIAATNITGHYGLLASESKMSHPRMRGNMDLENMYRCTVQPIFAGGTANVMRTIIAMRGMGLPRAY